MTSEIDQEILFDRQGYAGIVTLNRPKALNAVTHNMILRMDAKMREWEADAAVKAVIVKGEGRAFSAGGDIMDVYRAGKEGRKLTQFFADEYRLNAYLARYSKPVVSLIDGIVMGGGVGLSFHGSHRVLGEKALFAMPEVGIGFFPDVGGGYLLSRVKGGYGMFLGLTGGRIGPGDTLRAGLATHAVKSENIAAVEQGVAETGNPDAVLAPLAIRPEPTVDESTVAQIGHHFTRGSLEDLIESLRQGRQAGEEFAAKTLALIESRSPTSVSVAFRQVTYSEMLDMDEVMRMEFRILNRMLEGHDFYEGIRAVLVDKGDTPRWSPPSFAEIDGAQIDKYFAPLPGAELQL